MGDRLYNKRISILLETTTKVNGRPVTDYEEYCNVWSNLSDLSATMQYKAMEAHLESTVLFNIKYSTKVSTLDDVIYKDKIYIGFRGKKYKVYLVDFHQYNHQDITLKATMVA